MPADPDVPGVPISLASPPPEVVLADVGAWAEGEGVRMTLVAGALIFSCRMDGSEAEVGMPIEALLEAIQTYTRQTAQA